MTSSSNPVYFDHKSIAKYIQLISAISGANLTANLRKTTREILALVEERIGFPLQVLEEPSLSTIAIVRMARGSVPTHVVRYRPSGTVSPD